MERAAEGILKGLYRFRPSAEGARHRLQIFVSGPIIREALRAQEILDGRFGVAADVWSATSYKALRNEALNCRRWNMLHPGEQPRVSYLERTLENVDGPFVAVSDYMKIVPDQIAPWVPGGLLSLGTDGFGRSDTRPALRRFFEIDAESIVVASLYALAQEGLISAGHVAEALKELGMDPEKRHPFVVE